MGNFGWKALAVFSFGVCIALVIRQQQREARLNEPERSEFYTSCLGDKRFLTTCQCIERYTIAATGIKYIKKSDDAKRKEFRDASVAATNVCIKISAKDLAEELKKAANDLLDASSVQALPTLR
jgi:hypothetical protein